jgi:uracil-DNA glycosylase
MHIYSKGPREAAVLVVGEAPGEDEVREGLPFVGYSGKELDKLLTETGFAPGACRITNVCHVRPPRNDISAFLGFSKKDAKPDSLYEHGKFYSPEIAHGLKILQMEIESMPNLELIIGLGNTPLWALTGQFGITRWRGSQMFAKRLTARPIPFVPTYHPAYILRLWSSRWIAQMDLRRARGWKEERYVVPDYDFYIRPSFAGCTERLLYWLSLLDVGMPLKLATDIETRNGEIACIGLADSPFRAMCIPLLTTAGSYWRPDEEAKLAWLLYRLLTHPMVEVIGQGFWFDQQYFARRLGFMCNLRHDTMMKQHVILPGVPKTLDFISSQHCHYHCYWKDESTNWDPRLGEEQFWIYNCKDLSATYEANTSLSKAILDFGMGPQLNEQMEMVDIALDMMLRGINVNQERKKRVAAELEQAMLALLHFVNRCLGIDFPLPKTLEELDKIRHFKPSSPPQVQSLAYKVLQLPPQWKKTDDGGRRLTADKDAIAEWLTTADPLYRPLLQAIVDYRSLQVFRSTFALADLDTDGRWRCLIKAAGPHTFRWATAEDAFGFGTNMQNIPKGDEDE